MSQEPGNFGSYAEPDVQRCPFPFIEKLHKEAPVYKDPQTGMYIITRYDDVSYICDRPEIFSNKTPIVGVRDQSEVADEVSRRYRETSVEPMHTLVVDDPPSHTIHRALVDKVFSPSYVKSREPAIELLVDELIDVFAGTGHANLMTELAMKLPLFIIADELGIDRKDYLKLKLWSDVTVERNNPLLAPERELEIVDHLIEMQNYLIERSDAFEAAPNGTLLSNLVHVDVGGRKLTRQELVAIVHQLLVGGNETTTTALTTAIYVMLKQPAVAARLHEDRKLIVTFIEEVLRAHSPIPHMYRTAREDVEISGTAIPAGSLLMISFLAGNHDTARWQCPESIDPARKGVRSHLAFGRGIHFCVGNQLARSEMKIVLNKILDRLPNLQLASDSPEPQFVAHFAVHGLDHLQVQFDPSPVAVPAAH